MNDDADILETKRGGPYYRVHNSSVRADWFATSLGDTLVDRQSMYPNFETNYQLSSYNLLLCFAGAFISTRHGVIVCIHRWWQVAGISSGINDMWMEAITSDQRGNVQVIGLQPGQDFTRWCEMWNLLLIAQRPLIVDMICFVLPVNGTSSETGRCVLHTSFRVNPPVQYQVKTATITMKKVKPFEKIKTCDIHI